MLRMDVPNPEGHAAGGMQGTQGKAAKLAECASEVFSQRLTQACQAEPHLFSQFINRLFNTLNWTATELTSSLKVRHPSALHLPACSATV